MITYEEAESRARILKAMAHPVRLMIIELLRDGERSFSEIKENFSLDKSTVSKHLSILKDAGVVSSRRIGTEVIYRLEITCAVLFFECATKVIEENIRKQSSILSATALSSS